MSVRKPKFCNIPTEQLDSLIKHQIPYERSMMRESLAAALNGAPNQFQHNLHVEGFALHARNLIEFLKNGDACSFHPADFTTPDFSIERTFIRGTLVEMINTQISHLTTGRTEKREEKFDAPHWRETAEAVEEELNRWIANLKPVWAAKWEQRERMGDEVEGAVINTEGHVAGASSAVTFSNQNGTTSLFVNNSSSEPSGAQSALSTEQTRKAD
jgi:hypothetical protein